MYVYFDSCTASRDVNAGCCGQGSFFMYMFIYIEVCVYI
jgi:hypothetical protein